MRPINRRLFTLGLLVLITQSTISKVLAAAPSRAPKFLGEKITVEDRIYTAVKKRVGKKVKLVWNRGIFVPPKVSPTPAPSATFVAPQPQIPSAREVIVGNSGDIALNSVTRIEALNRFGQVSGYFVSRSQQQLIALKDSCTHQGCGLKISNEGFLCPCHSALFSLEDGSVLRGPAAYPLEQVPIKEADSKIIITD